MRYRVSRKSVKFKGHTYCSGDLLPESFSERDIIRNAWPSRIEKVLELYTEELPEVIEEVKPEEVIIPDHLVEAFANTIAPPESSIDLVPPTQVTPTIAASAAIVSGVGASQISPSVTINGTKPLSGVRKK